MTRLAWPKSAVFGGLGSQVIDNGVRQSLLLSIEKLHIQKVQIAAVRSQAATTPTFRLRGQDCDQKSREKEGSDKRSSGPS